MSTYLSLFFQAESPSEVTQWWYLQVPLHWLCQVLHHPQWSQETHSYAHSWAPIQVKYHTLLFCMTTTTFWKFNSLLYYLYVLIRVFFKGSNAFDRCEEEGCGKAFTASHHLKTHRRSHSDKRTFVCPHNGCRRSFTSRNTLIFHFASHNSSQVNC